MVRVGGGGSEGGVAPSARSVATAEQLRRAAQLRRAEAEVVAQRSSVDSGSPCTLMSSPTSAPSHHRSDDAQRPPPPPPQPSSQWQRPELPSRTVARGVRSEMGAGAVSSAFSPVTGGHRSGAPGVGPRPAAGRAVAVAVAAESTGSRGDTAVAAAVAAPWQQQQQQRPRSNAVDDGAVMRAGDDGTVVRESAAARREGGTGQQQLTSTVDSCLRAANAQAKRWFEELDVNGDGGLDQVRMIRAEDSMSGPVGESQSLAIVVSLMCATATVGWTSTSSRSWPHGWS
eukprot:COSAG01_NODE_5659_length_4114_cov_12.053051_7_plen_286_part_00